MLFLFLLCRLYHTAINTNVPIVLKFTFDLTRIDNVDDEIVSCEAIVGKVEERNIEKCKLECPCGFSLVPAFIENVCLLIKQLEEEKKRALASVRR